MATKQIAWTTGSGYITLTYNGQGDGTITVSSDDNTGVAREQIITIETTAGTPVVTKNITIRQEAYVPPILNFSYTGTVQSCTLPPGTYKLQVWGAQGGSVSGSYTAAGSKGGYSEGILTLTQATTVYIFVGGKGTDVPTSTTTSGTVNGGWNGGGGSVRKSESSSASSGYTYGISYPRGGGGATDIALVTSTMNYSSYRTNRSSASLLSRFIVAGGGGGASACYYEQESQETQITETITSFAAGQFSIAYNTKKWGTSTNYLGQLIDVTSHRGETCTFTPNDNFGAVVMTFAKSAPVSGQLVDYATGWGTYGYNTIYDPVIVPDDAVYLWVQINGGNTTGSRAPKKVEFSKVVTVTTSDSKTSTGIAYGGGTSGGGYSGGTQSGNSFGVGTTQSTTTIKFVTGGGGGGWYGGGKNQNSTGPQYYIDQGGGGSGFVNIAANSSYRPIGYTGLELDSGATYAGDTSFPSTSGSTETGHSGDGYARITCIDPNSLVPLTFDILGSGTIGWKTSNSSLTRTIQYKKNNGSWTSITSSTSGVTISVSSGDVVQFRGSSTAFATSSYYNYFTATCNFNVRGNIMSMFSNSGFESLATIPASYALRGLFYGNTYLKDASALLMPATTLTTYCYQNMFYGCTNMIGVPALPATTTQGRCYYRMFYNCSNITSAPVLNAATVATYGYYQMFYGCSKLNYIKCIATSISASNAVNGWVNGVAASGTFVKKSTMSSWTTGTSGIPSGWTVQNATS